VTDPSDDGDELMAVLAVREAENDAEVLSRMEFHDLVRDVPSPWGPLLRQVAHAHNEFEKARAQYGTTEGEPRRWIPVLDEAITALAESRRAGEQS
jgi:hypothetical protein